MPGLLVDGPARRHPRRPAPVRDLGYLVPGGVVNVRKNCKATTAARNIREATR